MPETEEVKPFNEGGVIGHMANPSDGALERLLGHIPKNASTAVKEDVESDADRIIRETAEAEKVQAELDRVAAEAKKKETQQQQSNEGKTKEEIEAEAKLAKEAEDAEIARKAAENKGGNSTTTEDETSVIGEFVTKFGEVDGWESLEDTTEGLTNYFEKLTPSLIEKGKEEGVKELFSEFPIVAELAQHINAGYGIESFQKKYEAFDYSKLELKEDNVKLQEDLVRAALTTNKVDKDTIDDIVELAKDKGKLFDKAKDSITVLDNIQKGELEQIKKQEKLASDAVAKQEADTIAQVDKILKTGNLAGVQLPVERIKALREFGTARDTDGIPVRDKKWAALSLEQLLLLDDIILNDFKGLGVKTTVATSAAKKLVDLKKKVDAQPKVDLNTSGKSSEAFSKITNGTSLKDILAGATSI